MDWTETFSPADEAFVEANAVGLGLSSNNAALVLAKLALAHGKTVVANNAIGLLAEIVSRQARRVDLAYALHEAKWRALIAEAERLIEALAIVRAVREDVEEIKERMQAGKDPELLARMQAQGFYLDWRN